MGADVSCIDIAVVQNIQGRNNAPIERGVSAVFKAGNRQPLQVNSQAQLDVQVNNKDLKHQFFVVNGLNESIILGMEFIKRHGLRYCPVDREFSWKDKSDWHKGALKMVKEEVLAPAAVNICEVQLLIDCSSCPGASEKLLVNIEQLNIPFLTEGPFLV